MGFVMSKPSLPMGTPIPGFPAVKMALHVDASCQLYLLADTPDWSLLLLLMSIVTEPSLVVSSRLVRWWTRLGPERLLVKRISENGEFTGTFFEAVIQMNGAWLGNSGNTDQDENGVYASLTALVELGQKGVEENFRPDFRPSLLWKSEDVSGTHVASVIVAALGQDEQRTIVRDIAKTIYWSAAGIDLFTTSAQEIPSPLSRWNKGMGHRLSGLVTRCLEPRTASRHIHLLTTLRAEIEKEIYSKKSQTGEPDATTATTNLTESPKSQLHGLAKVAGMRELKNLLENEVIKPLRDPEPFQRYGLTVPNGILLFGPPGCGKTYIARQLAEELGHNFVEIIPSEVASSYIHGSALRIRDLFDTAAENAPSVLFIDEFEALVPSRADLGGWQQYKAEEVNEFLAHLNSCADKKIFVIAATNEPTKIDVAVRRTGRLDKLIYVGPPDVDARREMLGLHLLQRPVDAALDISAIAGVLVGYSASDIKFLVDEAARLALDRRALISTEILLEALQRVPPSVTEDDEGRYREFTSRGI